MLQAQTITIIGHQYSAAIQLGTIKYYVIREVGGWARKWQFLIIYSTVNHQRGGWVGLKKSKT